MSCEIKRKAEDLIIPQKRAKLELSQDEYDLPMNMEEEEKLDEMLEVRSKQEVIELLIHLMVNNANVKTSIENQLVSVEELSDDEEGDPVLFDSK